MTSYISTCTLNILKPTPCFTVSRFFFVSGSGRSWKCVFCRCGEDVCGARRFARRIEGRGPMGSSCSSMLSSTRWCFGETPLEIEWGHMGSGVDSLVCLNKTNTAGVFFGATRFFILLCLLVLTFIPVDFLTISLSVLCSVFSPICWPNDQPHLPASKIST